MSRSLAVTSLTIAMMLYAQQGARAQVAPLPPPPVIVTGASSVAHHLTPLAWYGIFGAACTAGVSIAQAAMLQRYLTGPEVARNGLSCFLGPVGWWVGNQIFPDQPVQVQKTGRGGVGPRPGNNSVRVPPAGETRFVPNEILLRVAPGATDQYLERMARRLGLVRIETQTFTLTGQTIQRWRIDSGRSVAATLRAASRYSLVTSGQPNYLFTLMQPANPPQQSANPAQYVVGKLHLIEVHKITNGDNVAVAIIDSAIDDGHPDLAGIVTEHFDSLGGAVTPHMHGTGMAGAIGAHARLVGVAPKVRILAVRAFSGSGDSADGTTMSVVKGIDWAARRGARVINMSFAGPSDPLMLSMLGKAQARGIVLIAAVGNAGPSSPPLYPGADPHVIGITATDSEDHLLLQANRGRQVALAAPGVDILLPAPGGGYQVSSGTSVAAAHASGVAALLLARNPKLKPDDLRKILTATATELDGKRRSVEYGAGLIDPVKALDAAGAR
jgi:hypothetical protein